MKNVLFFLICVFIAVSPTMSAEDFRADFTAGLSYDVSQKVGEAGGLMLVTGIGPSFTAHASLGRFGVQAVFEPIFLPLSLQVNGVSSDFEEYDTFLLMNAIIGLTYSFELTVRLRFSLGGGVMAKIKVIDAEGTFVETLQDYSLDAILLLPTLKFDLTNRIYVSLASHFGLYTSSFFSALKISSQDISIGGKIGIGFSIYNFR